MIFNKVENSYIGLLREETDGTRLFYPRAHSKPHFMNKTVYEIWDLIDNRSAQEIVNILKHKYPGVSEQRLLNDVNHTIAYVKYFTFEPYIAFPDSKYGYKKENIYYFDEAGLIEL